MKALTRTNIKGIILSKCGAVLALALVCLFAVHGLQAETVNVKNPQALPVVDKANVLTPAQTDDLSSRILALGKTDGTQLVVLTVPTTGDEDSFSFAQRIATEWGIGQKKNDNGVLFMVAKNDRRVQFQVGYGLEGRLTDALSKRIQTSVITPEFKKGDYYKGISQGVNAIIAVVKGEYKAPPEKQHKNKGGAFSFLILFIIIVFFARSLGRGGPGGRGGRGGNIWMTGGGSGGGWGSSGGDSGGGFGGGGFGGGGFGGGGAGSSW